MKYLIVNADDFALTRGISEGIIDAHSNGIVSSTTVFANMPLFGEYSRTLRSYPKLGVGVHLTLSQGSALTKGNKTIAKASGEFFKHADLLTRIDSLDSQEVLKEFTAQIDKVCDAGVEITHLDTHQHLHNSPNILDVVKSLCKKYDVAMRRSTLDCSDIRTTDAFCSTFSGDMATTLSFKMILKKFEKFESLEMMCHPGIFEPELLNLSRYNKKREIELSVLKAYELHVHLESHKIELINYRDLK